MIKTFLSFMWLFTKKFGKNNKQITNTMVEAKAVKRAKRVIKKFPRKTNKVRHTTHPSNGKSKRDERRREIKEKS